MYLTRIITDFEDRKWPGVGIIPAEVKMSKKLQALGYIEATALKNSIVARKGEVLRGHEFHYSQIMGLDNNQSAYSLVGGKGEDYRREGYVDNNLLASYIHLHFRSNPSMAARFLQACRGFKG